MSKEEIAKGQEDAQQASLADMSLDDAVKYLAGLGPLEYDQRREEAAKQLNVRIGTLDKEVKATSKKDGTDNTQGVTISLYEPEPWPDPVDGHEVLQLASEAIRRHMVIRRVDADACAL